MPGLASLLSRRTMNPRAGGAARRRALQAIPRPIPQRRWKIPTSDFGSGRTPPPLLGPPGGKNGGQVKGYSHGGVFPRHGSVTEDPTNPGSYSIWKRGRTIGDLMGGGGRSIMPTRRPRSRGPVPVPTRPTSPPGGWQLGGEVGASPEEVAMASEIFARATPEQQAQITGGGGGPGMMEEEAAIGEALAMALGGGGGGPPMNGAPPMGGMI